MNNANNKIIIYLVSGILIFGQNIILSQNINIPDNEKKISGNKITESDEQLNNTGCKNLEEKKYLEAEKYFLKAIAINPAVKYYYNNLSVTYINQEKYVEAYNNLKIAILLDPYYVKALSNMAITCFYRFKFFESYHYYLKARETNREYTIKRFDRKKAEIKIAELHKKNPGNKTLEKILIHLKQHSKE